MNKQVQPLYIAEGKRFRYPTPTKPIEIFHRIGSITEAGELCRVCNVPVVKVQRSKPVPKANCHHKNYWYAFWLHCTVCKRNYFIAEGKRKFGEPL